MDGLNSGKFNCINEISISSKVPVAIILGSKYISIQKNAHLKKSIEENTHFKGHEIEIYPIYLHEYLPEPVCMEPLLSTAVLPHVHNPGYV